MFPTTFTSLKYADKISPTSAVVVVLPLVPVIAASFPLPTMYASSTSPQIGTSASLTLLTNGASIAMPGLKIIKSVSFITSSDKSPRTTFTLLLSSNLDNISSLTNFSFPSYIVTVAPTFFNKSVAAIPLFPEPATNTFLSFNSISFSL